MARVVLWLEEIRKTGRGNYSAPAAGVEEVIRTQRPFGYQPLRADITDYSHANGAGSRGIKLGFILDPGKIYRVSSPQSWSRVDRYYCVVKGDTIKRIEAAEVLTWGS